MSRSVTARYGSPALLPDVLRLDLAQGRLGFWIQAAALRFWVRCDLAAGLQALQQALSWRGPNGEINSGLFRDVLEEPWRDEALPFLLGALDDNSVEICAAAAGTLARHAPTAAVTEKVVATAERLQAMPLPEPGPDRENVVCCQNDLVKCLLETKAWTLTHSQWVRLQALPNNRPSIREEIDQRVAKTAE